MSRIDDLLAELAPNGVEYRELQAIFELRNGYTPSRADASLWNEGTVPWFRMEDIRANGGVLHDSIQHVSKSAVKNDRLFPADSIIVATSATIGQHALIAVPHLCNQRFTSLSAKPELRAHLVPKFAYYYCFKLDEWCRDNTSLSSFESVDMSGFRRFRFPIPPLEVQHEIVRILDTFAELKGGFEVELVAERELRKQQYRFVRDQILQSPEVARAEKAPIGEAVTNLDSRRRPVTRSARQAGNYPYYGANGVQDWVGDYLFEGTFLLVGEDGSVTQKDGSPVLNWATGKIWVNNHAHVLAERPGGVSLRFLFHYLQSVDIAPYVTGGTQPKLNQGSLNRIDVPVPSRAVQDSIVETLDSLEVLVTELTANLTAELAARRTQYEYYRDKLLTFREAPA